MSTYRVLDTVLDAGETTVIKKTKSLPLWSLHSSRERQTINRQETDSVLWRKIKQETGYISTGVGETEDRYLIEWSGKVTSEQMPEETQGASHGSA